MKLTEKVFRPLWCAVVALFTRGLWDAMQGLKTGLRDPRAWLVSIAVTVLLVVGQPVAALVLLVSVVVVMTA